MPEGPEPPPVSERSTIDQEGHSSAGSFGRYHLLQRLGAGGMGEVWLAEQTEPVRRQVALKVIKAGMDSAHVVARFEAERQALALMDHPVIATVLDGGTTPQGRPYFAMEYVRGEPITLYCDRHRLSTPERLELFMKVCEGVQHAHQKGIIHRDLKPSNVLVTIQDDRPVPKIIDFGVAKATAQHLTERSLFTELGVLIGTPEYMSPEQAEMGGLDIDTRTDIYALGVLLYELLTGALPFDRKELRQAGLAEIQRIIREKEPPRPSTRITQLGPASTETAKNRHTEPRRLVSELRGDLDWITMRALEKDRTRRYQTANALAADVRRHLAHEPVSAGPPSAAYRAGKFVRRHRFGVAAGVTLMLLLATFAGAMAVQAQRIARERDRANREAESARQVSEFLVQIFASSDPSEARGDRITARELLDAGAERIETELREQRELQARLQEVMARAYVNLGLFRKAGLMADRSLQTRSRALGPRHPDTLVSINLRGVAAVQQGDTRVAEESFRAAVEGSRATLGPDHPQTLKWSANLAGLLTLQGKYEEAESLERGVLEKRKQKLGSDHRETLQSLNNLASLLIEEGRLAEAETCQREGLAGSRRALGANHPETLIQAGNLGELLRLQGKYADAESYLREALTGSLQVLPAEHPDLAYLRLQLGLLLNATARPEEAEVLLREALPSAGDRETVRRALAEALTIRKRFPEAEAVLLDEHGNGSGGRASFKPGERDTVKAFVALYEAWGKPEKAREWRAKLETQDAAAAQSQK
jgi:tetratricopeptide (TPR) repeat protein